MSGQPTLASLCASGDWTAAEELLSELPESSIANALATTHGSSAWTPLHYASLTNPTPGVLGRLLTLGASPAATGAAGSTPLHLAAWHGTDAVAVLLNAGADVEARTVSGRTPLHFAAVRGRAEAVRLLMNAGARDQGDGDGVSAREFARAGGWDGVIGVLDDFARGDEVVGVGVSGVLRDDGRGGVVRRAGLGFSGLQGGDVHGELDRFVRMVRSDVVIAGVVGFVLGVLAPSRRSNG